VTIFILDRIYSYVQNGHGHLRGGVGAIKSLKTAKPLKQGVRIVDIFKPLTVNWLLGRLVNTLADKANGADSRR